MAVFENPHRGTGLSGLCDVMLSVDVTAVAALLARCPEAGETPLRMVDGLVPGALWLKDETGRMGLGSFKALGAAYVIARDAEDGKAVGRTYVAASAGNHGLSVAAGARAFGARAVIVLADSVPEGFADRLRGQGAEVVRAGKVYEDSMDAAMRMAGDNGWSLLSDSSWPGYLAVPALVMEGYLALAAEAARQVPEPPSHIFLQAGVGGMAASVAAHARHVWGDGPCIVVVEPEAAPCLMASVRAGRVETVTGPVSAMGRLDCKTPSLIALAGLARDADLFLTISEDQAQAAVDRLAAHGIGTTPSGAAGVAGALSGAVDLSGGRVLAVVSETDAG